MSAEIINDNKKIILTVCQDGTNDINKWNFTNYSDFENHYAAILKSFQNYTRVKTNQHWDAEIILVATRKATINLFISFNKINDDIF